MLSIEQLLENFTNEAKGSCVIDFTVSVYRANVPIPVLFNLCI